MEMLGYDKVGSDSADLYVIFSKDVVGAGKLFVKALSVRVVDRKSSLSAGKEVRVWEAHTEEKGWCHQILITAPHIIAAMFENFDLSVVNKAKAMGKNEELAMRVMETGPYELDCGSPFPEAGSEKGNERMISIILSLPRDLQPKGCETTATGRYWIPEME